MTRLKQTATTLSAILMMLAGCHLSAFEQGTYLIYQVVDKSETKPIEKRLTVKGKFFSESHKAQAKVDPEAERKSEFEMDYSSLGTTNNSSFETFSTSSSKSSSTTSQSSAFDLGTQNDLSSFGN